MNVRFVPKSLAWNKGILCYISIKTVHPTSVLAFMKTDLEMRGKSMESRPNQPIIPAK